MKAFPIGILVWGIGGSIVIFSIGAFSYRYEHGYAASIPLYMLLTLLIAWRGGFKASIPVAVSSTIGLDYFFTEPRFAFRVASPQDIFALVSFAGASLLVSRLSNRIKNHADQIKSTEEEQRSLYELSRNALLIDWNSSVENQLCALCMERLQLQGVAIWIDREARFSYAGDAIHSVESLQACFRAARNADLPAKSERFRLLRFGARVTGALYLLGSIEPLAADAVATLLATHLERVRALKAEVAAASQTVSEQLRTAVLDGLAHAVKTPLTTILVSSSGLKEIGDLSPLQTELAGVIQNQASYLATLTDQLLRTSHLEAREVVVQRTKVNIPALLESIREELRIEYDISRIKTTFSEAIVECSVDAELVRMAIVQVLENALKYSPDSTRVALKIEVAAGDLKISVHNDGSYIPPSERELVFERYYRSPSVKHGAAGTGIGLSVSKRAIEAQSGRIWIESGEETGTTFTISVPIEEDQK